MKILLVHNNYQEPGGEGVVFEQERALLERAGYRVLTYRRSNNEINRDSVSRKLKAAMQTIWAEDTRQEVLKLIQVERPDLVHVHNTFMRVSPSIYSACREAGVPVVQTLHNYRLFCPAANFFRDGRVCEECSEYSLWRGVRYGCYRESRAATATVAAMLAVHRWRRTWLEQIGTYIALTEFARQRFIAGGLPPEKIRVKPNFVHPDPGERTDDGRYAVFVGRLSPEKGLPTLMAAWQCLRGRIPLIVIGDGPLRGQLQAEMAERGISTASFQGHLKREEVLAAIKGASFLILPSECYENFPMGIAEAFACGTPAICSRLGSMQEIVEDARTGLHFTPGDPWDLAAKVDWAWTHGERMRAMGKEARREYEAKYTAEKNYPILMDIYRHATRNHDCVALEGEVEWSLLHR